MSSYRRSNFFHFFRCKKIYHTDKGLYLWNFVPVTNRHKVLTNITFDSVDVIKVKNEKESKGFN